MTIGLCAGFRKRDEFVGDVTDGESCGMCCAWHPWGNVFATAFQSGQVTVWDVRSYKVSTCNHLQPCSNAP
jgi:WD40 repeat protein